MSVLCLARNQVFPAIVFSALSFSNLSSGLIGLVSTLGRLAHQQALHMGKSDCQVGFVGNGLFGRSVLLAIVL